MLYTLNNTNTTNTSHLKLRLSLLFEKPIDIFCVDEHDANHNKDTCTKQL